MLPAVWRRVALLLTKSDMYPDIESKKKRHLPDHPDPAGNAHRTPKEKLVTDRRASKTEEQADVPSESRAGRGTGREGVQSCESSAQAKCTLRFAKRVRDQYQKKVRAALGIFGVALSLPPDADARRYQNAELEGHVVAQCPRIHFSSRKYGDPPWISRYDGTEFSLTIVGAAGGHQIPRESATKLQATHVLYFSSAGGTFVVLERSSLMPFCAPNLFVSRCTPYAAPLFFENNPAGI